ncbi:DUF1479-domain-containing protein [Cutaneotrichosporon oleaginosum]|uniref:DUF1479-domain-containing protein n=1 Tax=Cutaneotrichosporon oleaginosum TaxID=879819 RepID=A0A0J0XCQ7_9TREE|nr:DUF1479-domain-containing protein [Cutaneotrichosporon oleaginosum]KLT38846.1 DUF1479-domain-containing protein [Cutaneotrichosporon oleaginosum]TXT03983.1 hypothetical protein COLE_07680 [Cutaneotrichosporon oleaginosum]
MSATATHTATKRTGDIGSVFAQFSGGTLPPHFARLKRELVPPGREEAVIASWHRLLARLHDVTAEIEAKGSDLIPEVQFAELDDIAPEVEDEVRARGMVVVRGVTDTDLGAQLRSYVRSNPVTGFPKENPQVFEVYWSPAQVGARAHSHVLKTQRWANRLFHAGDGAEVDLDTPVSYCDRARIRQPGDTSFALGPHADGGSIELWEDKGYRALYRSIFAGEWEKYDAYDAVLRDGANSNLHDAVAHCGVTRTWQGWLSLSHTGAGEGTLQVYPALREATAYILLRPFFRALLPPHVPGYLAPENWVLDLESASFPGAALGKTIELSPETHPHLRLDKCMVPMRRVRPGDYVLWHCEGVHAVESVHEGAEDSSVLYIGACPLTKRNACHLRKQRDCFERGESGPDFPAGVGEADFDGRATAADIKGAEGRRAMGLEPFDAAWGRTQGVQALRRAANEILFSRSTGTPLPG